MNAREEKVADRYLKQGWKVLRGGAPDFLMIREEAGDIREAMAVEVKSPTADLTYEQAVYRMVLKRAGIRYEVEVTE